VLLYFGVRSGALRPTSGTLRVREGWIHLVVLAAVGIFVIGGLFAIAVGLQTLRHPEPVIDVAVGVAVLLVSAGLEAMSWRTAHRQLRSEAAARHLDLGEYLATSSDPRQPQCSWRTRQH
jgi:protein-S-isoprenylcysteine O-methyltransferase Ste14